MGKSILMEDNKQFMDKNIFRIEPEEYITKNLRLRKDLVDQGSKISQDKNISFNKFVNIAIEFAINHYEDN